MQDITMPGKAATTDPYLPHLVDTVLAEARDRPRPYGQRRGHRTGLRSQTAKQRSH